MKKQDINVNKERKSFSKKIKRKILLEIVRGKNPKDVFSQYVFDVIGNHNEDAKYVAKLLHRWRLEVYKNKEMMYLINQEINNEILEDEIKNIGSDEEINEIDLEAVTLMETENFEDIIEKIPQLK